MPRPEHRAALLLLGLALAGQLVRLWVARPEQAPGAVRVLGTGSPQDPQAHRDSAAAAGQPLRPGERVDVDHAAARDLARVPRLGPRLAGAIVADRVAHGPFGRLEALDRVPGVGPGLLRAIDPYVGFSGEARSPDPAPGGSVLRDPAADCQSAESLRCQPPRLDLNAATANQLERLTGIGPSLADRIVGYREKHGRFTTVDDLIRVAGVGPVTLARVRDRVEVR